MNEMPGKSRHGVLLIDEMKLTKGAYFDASTLRVEGIADLSPGALEKFEEEVRETFERAVENLPHDPKLKQKVRRREAAKEKTTNQRDRNLGDHALVITFQPFKGTWVQNIACFLTRGNANAGELTKLVLEAVILCEHSGLFVDSVITDGASWNRSMWKNFGVDETNTLAEHPCDEARRLYFISDCPHLLKCSRNCMVDKKIKETPQGDVQLKHWQAVVDADNRKQVGLRECPRLTADVINVNSWTKMKCNLAWQFWSSSAAVGMASYRFQGVDELEDCETSINFCKLMNDVSDIMNSRIPVQALRPNSDKTRKLEEFLERIDRIQNFRLKKRLQL
ncbi:Transposable element P transposase [Frankliniella fusca]|uniref:Transposable element P transposase n=1 Tax=Frankliniella fusca TaxID=407009 RepID=A0AAE1I0Z2_9NEOP|nr:Transposable element P transposase [Frankliniella fusca]